jgi:hypothetical protein
VLGLQSARSSAWRRNVASHEATIVLELVGEVASARAVAKACDIERCA